MLLRAASIFPLVWGSFPNSASPITADPPIDARGSLCASVAVFEDAHLTNYGQIAVGTLPAAPCDEVSGVVLRFDGAVQGVQFDRYGAMWVGGVEVLRTTTPEPTPAGIHWHIEKDLTEYASLFRQPQNVSLSIPNVVNPTYTGVLAVNVTFDFYTQAGASVPIEVVRLLDQAAIEQNPWNVMGVGGNGALNVSLPALPAKTERLFLDLFASNHGCEEFEAGFDCGGPLRRLRVHVDGNPAGVMYPYPTIYTGGVNPILWRPLTGIDSFNMPAYRFELTPFLPLLADGSDHLLIATVDHDTSGGTWYLDPVLLCVLGDEELQGGELLTATLDGSYTPTNPSNETMLATDVSELNLRARLDFPSGSKETSVKIQARAWANYTTIGGGGGPTTPPPHRLVTGLSTGSVEVGLLAGGFDRASFAFPYAVALNQVDGEGFRIDANVTYGRHGTLDRAGPGGFAAWNNDLSSSALYQKDGAGKILAETNAVSETYQITTTKDQLCYDRALAATEGGISADSGRTWTCGEGGRAAARATLPALGVDLSGTDATLPALVV